MTDKQADKVEEIKTYLGIVASMAANSPYWNQRYDNIAKQIADLFSDSAIRRDERKRILALLEEAYPAITTWDIFKNLKQEG